MTSLFSHLWGKVRAGLQTRRAQPSRTAKKARKPGTVKLFLEVLEDRELLTTYIWSGNVTGDPNASNPANWLYQNAAGNWVSGNAANTPGANDDLRFATTDPSGTVAVLTPAQIRPCEIDAAFTRQVKSLTIDTTYGQKITLDSDFLVTNQANVGAGVINGSGALNIGDQAAPDGTTQYTATLNWTGGTFGDGWVPTNGPLARINIGAKSKAVISQPGAKTLAGRMLDDFGTIQWTQGNLVLTSQGQVTVDSGGVMNAQPTAAVILDGSGGAATQFTIAQNGTLNLNPTQAASYAALSVSAKLINNGSVNIDANTLATDADTTTTGTYTIQDGSSLLFNNAHAIALSGATLQGNGSAYFGSGSTVTVTGAVKVGNVDDNSGLLTGAGTLTINGNYVWRGAGQWTGAGTTNVGAAGGGNASLTLDANGNGGGTQGNTTAFSLGRSVVINAGSRMVWVTPVDINMANGVSITNNNGATFDINVSNLDQPGQQMTGGSFTNGGTLKNESTIPITIGSQFIPLTGGQVVGHTETMHFAKKVNLRGALEVDAGATVAFDGGMEQDGGNVNNAGLITVAGDYALNAGAVTLSAGEVNAANVNVAAGAALSGDGAVNANVANAGEVDSDASGNPLAVAGKYTQTGAGVTNVAAATVIPPGGGAPVVVASLTVSAALDEQGGYVHLLQGGALAVNGGYTVEAGAQLDGTGTVTADVTNNGVVQVATANGIGSLNTAASSSAGAYGNLTEASTASLDVALASATSYDTLSVAGATLLGGTLNVQLLNGFAPTAGEWFVLMPNATSGQFAVLNLPTVNGVTFLPEYNAPGEGGFVLLAVPTTGVSLSSSSDPSYAGQSVTFTASLMTGGSATGQVSFYDGATLLGVGAVASNHATFTTSALAVGSHSITAVYGGDSGHAGGGSAALTQQVNAASRTSTQTYLYLSPSSASYGQAVTFYGSIAHNGSATVTGTISFYDGSTLLATVAVSNGNASFTTSSLSIGSHTITAVYSGDANYDGSTSFSSTETIQ